MRIPGYHFIIFTNSLILKYYYFAIGNVIMDLIMESTAVLSKISPPLNYCLEVSGNVNIYLVICS